MTEAFDEHREQWRAYTATPWGRIRYALVGSTLAGLDDHLGAAPWRVLDVGGGDGLDAAALLARGHEVTVLDPSPTLLEDAAAAGCDVVQGGLDDLTAVAGHGAYDLVLCHYVLQYRPQDAPDLSALVGAARPGGLVSLIAPNPDGMVLGALVREGPDAALDVLAASGARAVTFDTEVRKLWEHDVRASLEGLGCAPVRRTGGRVVNDLVADNTIKHDPDWFARLHTLEAALHDREPFRRIGQYWHLVARTPASSDDPWWIDPEDGRSNRERWLAGDPYIADAEVGASMQAAARLTSAYNASDPGDEVRRRELLRQLLGSVGDETVLMPPIHVDHGRNLRLGSRCFVNYGLVALDVAPITIGDDVQIGPGVQLLTATHPLDPGLRRATWESAEPITIGDNAWLGGGVLVLPGVTIGADTVVGAGSVVVHDLPERVLAVGNPARVVRPL